MKLNKILMPVAAGSLLASTALAQVDMTITGSTAFRSIAFDRVQSLFDAGYTTAGDLSIGPGTYQGTMSNAIPALGSQTVTLRLSFSGSGAGMLAVDNSTPVPTVNPGGGNANKVPDLAFSDVFPESATPTINGGDFDQSIVGVIPFVYVVNNGLTGITTITREQAVLLMTASGPGGMPATFLGGSSGSPVFLTGRDSGSGTRITIHKDIGFSGSPTLWGLSGGNLVITNGYSSGGNERVVIAATNNVIGYLGLADAAAIASTAHAIAYEGVTYSASSVQNGNYPLWGYEHLVNRTSMDSDANKIAVRNKLVAAITDQTYQTTNPNYTANFVDQNAMHVQRGTDGGTITSLDF